MKNIYALVILAFTLNLAHATTYTSIGTGNWLDDSRWSSAPADNDCDPAGNHTYNIATNMTSTCASLDFSGNVIINILSGAIFQINGSGGITGNVTINIAQGSSMIVMGNLNLQGSSNVIVDGSLTVYGNIVGAGGIFDCNGSLGGGTVSIGGTGCSNCTNTGDVGCNYNSPLPVNMVSFLANSTNNTITLSWITSYEKNNNRFELERSNDGTSFIIVYTQAGKLNYEGQTVYTFNDEDLEAGTYYYRLVQVDLDGSQTRSAMVSQTIGGTGISVEVSPNPSTASNMHIDIANAAGSDVLLVLQDIQGNTICSKLHSVESGIEYLSIQELYTDIAPGIYFVSASIQNKMVSKKLIIY